MKILNQKLVDECVFAGYTVYGSELSDPDISVAIRRADCILTGILKEVLVLPLVPPLVEDMLDHPLWKEKTDAPSVAN